MVGHDADLTAACEEEEEEEEEGTPTGRSGGVRHLGEQVDGEVDLPELMRGLARQAVRGEVFLAMAAGDGLVPISRVYEEVHRQAVRQGILPFPLYTVRSRNVAACIASRCRLIDGIRPEPEPGEETVRTGAAGEVASLRAAR